MKQLFLLSLCFLFSRCCDDTMESGIAGTVVNEQSELVADVTISYMVFTPSNSFFSSGKILRQDEVNTDSLGRFEIIEVLKECEYIEYFFLLPDIGLPYSSWIIGTEDCASTIIEYGDYCEDVMVTLVK